MILYGQCFCSFGRDSLGPRKVEVVGRDFIVARNLRGEPEFADIKLKDHESILKESASDKEWSVEWEDP